MNGKDMKLACTVLEEPLVTFETLKEVRAIEKTNITGSAPIDLVRRADPRPSTVWHHLLEANNSNKDARPAIYESLEELREEALSYRDRSVYLQKRAQLTA